MISIMGYKNNNNNICCLSFGKKDYPLEEMINKQTVISMSFKRLFICYLCIISILYKFIYI